MDVTQPSDSWSLSLAKNKHVETLQLDYTGKLVQKRRFMLLDTKLKGLTPFEELPGVFWGINLNDQLVTFDASSDHGSLVTLHFDQLKKIAKIISLGDGRYAFFDREGQFLVMQY